jgi:hypothetical protein
MERCQGCNTPGPWCWLASTGRCAWLAQRDERGVAIWAAHNVARSLIGPAPDPPVLAPPGVVLEPPLSVARVRDLWTRMLACPHRGPHACGCGALAACDLGKGSLGTVDHHDCRECLLAQDREGSGS